YNVQAVMDFARGRTIGGGPGNGYSKPVWMELDPATTGAVKLSVDPVVAPRPLPQTDPVQLLELPSKPLTKFHGRPVRLRAAVALPESFADKKDKKYPIIYEIPGFSGNHTAALGRVDRTDADGVEFLYVVLDPECPLGHHVFADSANNGPWGRALTEELIPHLEKKYRAIGEARARFVTGHSSGGWSSLWLQVAYPDLFGGVWSTAPDPVDFRDFQRINLYKPGVNMFTDDQGKARPIARRRGQ